ncbi:hypothetical protein RND81_04G129800 [Saponaria officinalis]|uniref:YtxH domain-containing protein n=1 Tax=Saponaria officinalis TaxID=3572 RepID=A0AAW1LNK6_SAPOF
MFWDYPPTRRQLVGTAVGVAVGVAFMTAGAYLSFANIEPQQARAKERTDYIRKRLRQLLDD